MYIGSGGVFPGASLGETYRRLQHPFGGLYSTAVSLIFPELILHDHNLDRHSSLIPSIGAISLFAARPRHLFGNAVYLNILSAYYPAKF